MSENNQLEEKLQISTMGKILLAGAAAFIIGRLPHLKIKGSPEEIEVVKSALLASKKFHEMLNQPGQTAEKIIQQLNIKNMSADAFTRTFGIPWPL